MRESSWRITWNPLGSSPRVMLDFGDLMEREIALDSSQLSAVGAFDFDLSATPSARGNRRRRLDFGKRKAHDSDSASWHECGVQLAAGPWGGSAAGVIEIRPRVGSALLLRAALLSSTHEPVSDFGIAESVHEWSFRCTKLAFTMIGGGINIIGGWYNPPGGGITVIIPPGSGIIPGDVVLVDGIAGVPGGYYPVGSVGSSGGSPSITLPTAEPERDKPSQESALQLPPVSTASKTGNIHVTYPDCEIRVIGCSDGAFYDVWNGSTWVGVSPDWMGNVTITKDLVSTLAFGPWWGTLTDVLPGPPTLTPLPIDGQDRPNGAAICEQDGPSRIVVKLRRNGVEINSATFAPRWQTSNAYMFGRPANASLDAERSAVLTLIGPGGGTPFDLGVPGEILNGTISKVEVAT